MKNIFFLLIFFASIFVSSGQTYKIQYKRVPNVEYQLRNEKDPAVRKRVAAYLTSNPRYYELTHSGSESTYLPVQKSDLNDGFEEVANTSLNLYYKNFKENRYEMQSSIQGKTYHVRDSLIKYNWTIQNEFKQILEFKCQKATLKYRDNLITAYFTDEIPLSDGPGIFTMYNATILELQLNTFQVTAVGFVRNKESTEAKVSFSGVNANQKKYDAYLNALQLELQPTLKN